MQFYFQNQVHNRNESIQRLFATIPYGKYTVCKLTIEFQTRLNHFNKFAYHSLRVDKSDAQIHHFINRCAFFIQCVALFLFTLCCFVCALSGHLIGYQTSIASERNRGSLNLTFSSAKFILDLHFIRCS